MLAIEEKSTQTCRQSAIRALPFPWVWWIPSHPIWHVWPAPPLPLFLAKYTDGGHMVRIRPAACLVPSALPRALLGLSELMRWLCVSPSLITSATETEQGHSRGGEAHQDPSLYGTKILMVAQS